MYAGIRNEYVRRQDRAAEGPDQRFWRHWAEQETFLLHLCMGWLQGSELDAREVLSSAMLKAWDGAVHAKTEIGNYKAWLAKIVRNHCLDQLRKWNRDRKVKTDPEDLLPLTDKQATGQVPSPEFGMLKEESYQGLLAKMETLPKRLREVMMLRAYQNMSFKEIGVHLHITTENARKRVQTARDWLRDENHMEGPSHGNSEREAADAILAADRQVSLPMGRFAAPVSFHWHGWEAEWPVFQPHRPLRLAQKVDTLRRYVQQHPGGWRKELELGNLYWALGEPAAAKRHIAGAWQRQPQMPALALTYLHMLHDLGERETTREVAQALSEWDFTPGLQAMFLGFAAAAFGNSWEAVEAWGGGEMPMGRMLQARTLIATGNLEWASTLLRDHLQAHPMDREAFYWLMETQPADALALAKVAARRFPGDPYAQAHLLAARWAESTERGYVSSQQVEGFCNSHKGTFLALAVTVMGHAIHREDQLAFDAISEFLAMHPRHLQALDLAARWTGFSGISFDHPALSGSPDPSTRSASLPFANFGLLTHYWQQ